MPKNIHTAELQKDAADLADEIRRLGHRPDGSYDPQWAAERILPVLGRYENLLRTITKKAVDQFGKQCWGGSTEWGAAQSRRANIRADHSYGRECDTCGECRVESLILLRIGNYRHNMLLDICRKCAERVVQVVDARIEDRRIRENRRKGK